MVSTDPRIEVVAGAWFALLAVGWSIGPAIASAAGVIGLIGLATVVRRSPDRASAGQPMAGIVITGVAVIAGAVFVAWYVGDLGLLAGWSAGIAGVLVAFGALALARRSGAPRHRVLAMGSMLWGLVATVTWGDRGFAVMVPFLGVLGVAWLVTGGLALSAERRADA
jgi:hypothetical protein